MKLQDIDDKQDISEYDTDTGQRIIYKGTNIEDSNSSVYKLLSSTSLGFGSFNKNFKDLLFLLRF
ncbi:hypothetical protein A0H76_2729 [Hepatospora eriocheir]|uniref:Uncharacterized protein n=1 Tax=Hepatospora eriocheir TaxID=1081669 RepID=A0A1X0QF26_9MICR|nr:hypothetical protein A0H76_2729 [Hepatospora eriocheir]